MFTGIITHLGRFEKLTKEGLIFEVPPNLAKQITTGLSIAIDGVCLTVKKKKNTTIYVDVMEETLDRTNLGNLKGNALVNLELPVSLSTFLSGHIVQGHIDGKGVIQKIKSDDDSKIITINIPKNIGPYIIEKGSISVNGVSLTVIKTQPNSFTVGVIPYTWKQTMFQKIKVGTEVNIEVDILAKYLRNLLKKRS